MDCLIQTETYAYETIPQRGWIRLLFIVPSDDAIASISCRLVLHETRQASATPYEALSYTWGDEEARIPILVNGKSFLVRPNLHSALKALRRSAEERAVWVDAICINQDDLLERNHQVWQMNYIYSRATTVNVWLGEATKLSNDSIDLLHQFHDVLSQAWGGIVAGVGLTTLTEYPALSEVVLANTSTKAVQLRSKGEYAAYYAPILKLLDDPQVREGLDEAIGFLRRPWWKRIWTLQEAVLCGQVICLCGPKEVPIEHFYFLSYFVYYSINFDLWQGSPIDLTVSLREVWRAADLSERISETGWISMLLALDSSWNRKSLKPEDKILGLLGLIGQRKDLDLTYSMPVEQIYRSAFREAITESGDLSCLGLLSDKPECRDPKLPSWVPDFAIHVDPGSDYISSLSKPLWNSRIYNASLMRPQFKPQIYTEDYDTLLIAQGIPVDAVQEVGRKFPGFDIISNASESEQLRKEAMQSALQDWTSIALPSPARLYRNTTETSARAFWRTVLVDLKPKIGPETSWALGARRLDNHDISLLLQFDDEASSNDFCDQLIQSWFEIYKEGYRLRLIEQFNRRFFVTRTGYFGLGPPLLQVDDTICVLLGGRVAYALRRIPREGRWIYVGECYIHGIMDGEVIKTIEEEVIELSGKEPFSSPFQIFQIE